MPYITALNGSTLQNKKNKLLLSFYETLSKHNGSCFISYECLNILILESTLIFLSKVILLYTDKMAQPKKEIYSSIL